MEIKLNDNWLLISANNDLSIKLLPENRQPTKRDKSDWLYHTD